MSDENDTPEEGGGMMGQNDVDALMGVGDDTDDSSGGGMTYNEIEETGVGKEEEQEYEYGEAMISDVTAIYDIPVQISAVLGRSSMQVSQLLKLGRGAVVELDRKVGEAIDIYVNNRLVARGEVVVVEDKLGITMTEIVKSDRS